MKTKRKIRPDNITYENVIESVYHIIFLGNTTTSISKNMLSIGKKISRSEKGVLRVLVQSKTLIDTISLIDEMNNYLFSYNCSDEKIETKISSYKHIIQPILDQVDKWKDIRGFRNNVLAHNFRIDKNGFESVHLSNKLYQYNIPRSSIDLGVLFKLIEVITELAKDIFRDEYEEALKKVQILEQPPKKDKQLVDEEVKKINIILNEVNTRIDQFDKK